MRDINVKDDKVEESKSVDESSGKMTVNNSK